MALPDLCSTAMWVKFFTDSGIPNSVAANYAVTFYDNRITRNMLLDLNKEILQDMGIHVMGDVIAILKHAKVVHAQMTREKVYQSETSIASVSPVTLVQKKANPNAIQSNLVAARLSGEPFQSNRVAKKVSTRKRVIQEEVPVTKVRRVLPEHEGAYKITMPAGTTVKTRTLLMKKNNAAAAAKGSVFRRLGAETNDGASTSAVVQPEVVAKRQPKQATNAKGTSVFARLGPEMDTTVAETTDDDVIEMEDELSLEYEGILLGLESTDDIQKRVVLSPTVTATKPPIKKNVGTRTFANQSVVRFAKAAADAADDTSSSNSRRGIMGLTDQRMKSVYSRLGKKVTIQPKAMNKTATTTVKKLVTTTPKAVLKKKSVGNIVTTKKTGIKGRLGQTSVFGRLGPVVNL